MPAIHDTEVSEQRGHISSLPNETLIQILNLQRAVGENTHDYWRRLARAAGVNKKLASILRPSLYDRLVITLGDNIRDDENPADDHIRHLRRCSPCLSDTSHMTIDGGIVLMDNITSVYQRITIDHIARAASYATTCPTLQIIHAEILDPAGEQRSDRIEQLAMIMPSQRDIAEGIRESRTHRSIGVGTRESEREKKRREMAEADENEPKAGPPPPEQDCVHSGPNNP